MAKQQMKAKLIIEGEFDIAEMEEIQRIVSDELNGYAILTKAQIVVPAETIINLL